MVSHDLGRVLGLTLTLQFDNDQYQNLLAQLKAISDKQDVILQEIKSQADDKAALVQVTGQLKQHAEQLVAATAAAQPKPTT